MIPAKLQLALFFKNTLNRPDEKYISLNKQMNNLFDNTPTILPVPEDAPGDIPIVQLSSSRSGYNANISRKKTNLFYNPNQEEDLDEILKDFKIKVDNFIDYFVNIKRINRMGFVVDNFIIDKNSVETINNKYFKKDLSDSIELKIRFNERGKIDKFQYNNITEISNVTANIKSKTKKGILLHKDLNNVPAEDYLSKKQLMKLFNNFKECIESAKLKELV